MTTVVIDTNDLENGLKGVPNSLRKEIKEFISHSNWGKTKLILYISDEDVEIFEAPTKLGFHDYNEHTPDDNPEGSYTLPHLFCLDKKGKERVWKIWVVNNTVYKSYGEVGGLKVPSTRTYKGVNMGRSNETTAEEQAKREAERDWVKQLDKGYAPRPGKGDDVAKKILEAKKKQGNVNANIYALIRGKPDHKPEEPYPESKKLATTKPKKTITPVDNGAIPDFESAILPMHCQTWSTEEKVAKYFDFENGVYIQPKLDGIRCLAQLVPRGDTLTSVFLSRHGKQFVWLSHLRKELKDFLIGYEDVILDCEVYADVIHGTLISGGKKKKTYTYSEGDPELLVEQRFDVISGAVRPVRKEPHPLEDQLSLHVFDIADPTGKLDQDERFEIMKKLFSRKNIFDKCPHIRRVETKVINYPEEIEDYHDEVAYKGYEGVVIRARDLLYKSNERSLSMRKHKMFEEEEFPIVDIVCDEGVDREQFSWVCEKIVTLGDGSKELKTFNVKPMGTREQKWYWYDHSDEFLGKLLTVKYQKKKLAAGEETDVPRFPIGKAIRDYE